MSRAGDTTIRQVKSLSETQVGQLAEVLVDCVEGDASVSFMHPLPHARAAEFWRGIAADVERGARALLVAEGPDGIVGTVQLLLEQPENQPHRADLAKMLVRRNARGRGIGAGLLRAAEEAARAAGKSLLVLDTASDDAERLYARCGWIRVGTVPGYALLPRGGLCDTHIFYRRLDG